MGIQYMNNEFQYTLVVINYTGSSTHQKYMIFQVMRPQGRKVLEGAVICFIRIRKQYQLYAYFLNCILLAELAEHVASLTLEQ